MVYTGKPSRGCQTCKSRRIRCDEGRPTCQNCQKSGRSCPGFPDEFDLMFRNENAAVVRRVRRQASKTRSSTTTTDSRYDGVRAVSIRNSSITLKASGASCHFCDFCSPGLPESVHPWQNAPNSVVLRFHCECSSVARTDSFDVADYLSAQNAARPQRLTFASGIKMSIETQATSFFFQNFVIPPQKSTTVDTFLNCLVPYYNSTNVSSALHLATNAVSLSAFSKDPSRGQTAQEAGRAYGKALRKVGEALQDPASAATDETILSILLFALYESITSTNDSITAWKNHVSGAVTLTKLRGADGFSTMQSRKIFHAVRAMMLSCAIQKCTPIEDFSSSNDWHVKDEIPPNRLTHMSMGVANVRAQLKQVLDMPDGVQKVTEARKLLEAATEVDTSLQSWLQWLPGVWQPRTVAMVHDLGPDVQQATRWIGPVHVYPDIYAAHVLNDYRVCRITTQSVILAACSAISPNFSDDETAALARRARYITQQLVDDVCAGVPFHLEYDLQQQGCAFAQDREAATALGGYLLVWHLFVCANVETIPLLQRTWLQGRLGFVGRAGITQAQVLSVVRRREDANKFDSPGPAGPIPGPLTVSTATEALSGMSLDASTQTLQYGQFTPRAAARVGCDTRSPTKIQSW